MLKVYLLNLFMQEFIQGIRSKILSYAIEFRLDKDDVLDALVYSKTKIILPL